MAPFQLVIGAAISAAIAHAHGRQVSLTLSDSFCVDRHRDAFLDMVEHHVDVLFANGGDYDKDSPVKCATGSCANGARCNGSTAWWNSTRRCG